MYNVKKSDLYTKHARPVPRRSRREEIYYNRTRSRHLRRGDALRRLTTMALVVGLLSLILWSMG